MATPTHTLCKEERLCGKRAISELFNSGNSFFKAPYKVFWIKVPAATPYPSRFAVAVPKSRFKRAVKRNLMKRRTREIFRVNKHLLNDVVPGEQQVHLMVIYVSSDLLTVTELNKAMKKILQHIARQYAESV